MTSAAPVFVRRQPRSGWRSWGLAHGAVLILNAAAAAQLAMICVAHEYRVLPTFGFIVFVDLVYAVVARSFARAGDGSQRHV